MLSVIIPAKNEIYLERTIRNILENAEGEIEIIVVLDAWVPDPQIVIDDKRVIFLHFPEGVGQRKAINEGVKIAKGKYIMKLDAHCAVDKGFDVKLAADCEYEWTVVPRMYNLDSEKWVPKLHKRTDYMYIGCGAGRLLRAEYYTGQEYRKWHRRPELIDDTMCCMGPGWFMHKARFLEQGGCDENHEGGWGQQGVEVSCKAWLSGGALKVNKKTWFAHWFRGGSGPGFPYPISGRTIERVRKYSRDLWINNKWDKKVRNFQWLIDKFNPPGWKENDLTIIFYTANLISEKILTPVVRSLKRHGIPIVSVSQQPMDLGTNIVVPQARSLQNIYKQVLEGARKATTKYVALCEDDCLYLSEHFQFRPTKSFAYNLNRWMLHLDGDDHVYSYRRRPILSQCIANREALIKTLEERFTLADIPDKYCGEMGCFEDKLGITKYEYETFETKEPNLIVCHKRNTSGRKYLGQDAPTRTELAPYGNIDYWLNKFRDNSITSYEKRHVVHHKQNSHIGGRPFSVEHLWDNIEHYWDYRKRDRFPYFKNAVFPFFEAIHNGKQFTDEELRVHPYFDYLIYRMKPEERDKQRTIERCMYLIKSGITLYNNIKSNGMYQPLDMWIQNGKLNLYRGSRRLAIAKLLGYKTLAVRIFNSDKLLMKLLPDRDMVPDDTISGLAMKQFIKLGSEATDKYWIHNYMGHYDAHLSSMRNTASRILEIGVKRGASLLLWKEAFPNAHIYGVDKNIEQASMLKGLPGFTLFQGLQEDVRFIQNKVVPSGPFNIVIDDGSHRSKEQLQSFKVLWDSVAPGGYYIVEDLFRNYVEKKEDNVIKLFKDLIDELNLKCEISAMHFYYNICFIKKGKVR